MKETGSRALARGVDTDISKYVRIEAEINQRGIPFGLMRRVNFQEAFGALEEAIPVGADMLRHLFSKDRHLAQAADMVGLNHSCSVNVETSARILRESYAFLADFYRRATTRPRPVMLKPVSAASPAAVAFIPPVLVQTAGFATV